MNECLLLVNSGRVDMWNKVARLSAIALVIFLGGCVDSRDGQDAAVAAENETSSEGFERTNDVIYHKEQGYALTMDVIKPLNDRNGAAVVIVMSGGWFSNHEATRPHDLDLLPKTYLAHAAELLRAGYTLFYVVHGTQPKFTIREIDMQLSAALTYLHSESLSYGIDKNRIGIMGGSAGGHLSLMRGTKGSQSNNRVAAVVSYFPPTDFLNYGDDGVFFDGVVREFPPLRGKNPFLQALDYYEFDPVETRLNRVDDPARLAQHYSDIGPANHVSEGDAPTLLLHGDSDGLVPLQQSQLIAEKFSRYGVEHKLFIKEGEGHGWEAPKEEITMIIEWFDKFLVERPDEDK